MAERIKGFGHCFKLVDNQLIAAVVFLCCRFCCCNCCSCLFAGVFIIANALIAVAGAPILVALEQNP